MITAAVGWLAPVAQMAEAGGLNPLQHGFESHRGHCVRLQDMTDAFTLQLGFAGR
jgi:hypothetical protein